MEVKLCGLWFSRLGCFAQWLALLPEQSLSVGSLHVPPVQCLFCISKGPGCPDESEGMKKLGITSKIHSAWSTLDTSVVQCAPGTADQLNKTETVPTTWELLIYNCKIRTLSSLSLSLSLTVHSPPCLRVSSLIVDSYNGEKSNPQEQPQALKPTFVVAKTVWLHRHVMHWGPQRLFFP